MFYTLLKFLGWGIALAVIGGCVGWALRSLTARRDAVRARETRVDAEEADRLRQRLVELEQVATERDRLRIQLADLRRVDSPGIVGAPIDEVVDDVPDDPVDRSEHGTSGPS